MACHGPKRNAWHDQEVKVCPRIPPEQISVWHVWSTHNCWSPSAHGALEFLLHAKILALLQKRVNRRDGHFQRVLQQYGVHKQKRVCSILPLPKRGACAWRKSLGTFEA